MHPCEQGIEDLRDAVAGCASGELSPVWSSAPIKALLEERGQDSHRPDATCLAAVGMLIAESVASRILRSGDVRCPYLATVMGVGCARLARCHVETGALAHARGVLSNAVSEVAGRCVLAAPQSDPMALLACGVDAEVRYAGGAPVGRYAAHRARAEDRQGLGAGRSAVASETRTRSIRRNLWRLDHWHGGDCPNGC